jgi:hypothetical protein
MGTGGLFPQIDIGHQDLVEQFEEMTVFTPGHSILSSELHAMKRPVKD